MSEDGRMTNTYLRKGSIEKGWQYLDHDGKWVDAPTYEEACDKARQAGTKETRGWVNTNKGKATQD